MDAITLKRIELMHPKLRDEVRKIYTEICTAISKGAFCRFTHTLRTWDEQAKLYAQGRTAPGPKVTNAPAGSSYHNYALAIDIAFVRENGAGSWDVKADFDGDGKADWQEVVAIFEKYGWEWGGRWTKFPDLPHFQKTLGMSIPELRKRHIAKDFIPGTTYVRI